PEIETQIRETWEKFDRLVYQYDFTRSWINGLKERGYQVLYLSNWSYHLLELCKEALNFTELMDGGIFSCHVKLIKPDEAIYKCIIDRYGLNPEECVFLDDRKDNIEAAVRCGMKGIVVADHDEAAAKLEEYLAV
ncbi:MAG: HAD-IA family hydrolase, partial [Firmicutes bacterium]|nr:HAD-IA family hydrolase [Bacillota bacterium]